jgi:hypothetical protein
MNAVTLRQSGSFVNIKVISLLHFLHHKKTLLPTSALPNNLSCIGHLQSTSIWLTSMGIMMLLNWYKIKQHFNKK